MGGFTPLRRLVALLPVKVEQQQTVSSQLTVTVVLLGTEHGADRHWTNSVLGSVLLNVRSWNTTVGAVVCVMCEPV